MMENLQEADLTVEVADPQGGAIRIDLLGRSTRRDPAEILVPYFARVAEEAERAQASLEIHFEAMEHFNSSTVGAFVEIFESLRSRGIKHLVTFDPSLVWQRLSFDALKVLEQPGGLLTFKPFNKGGR